MAVDVNSFWYRVDSLRMSKFMSLADLQERLGMRGAYIYSIRSRGILPGLDTIWRMADIFGCSVDYLIGRDSVPARQDKDGNVQTANSREIQDIVSRLATDQKFFDAVSLIMKI